ncbi:phage tail tube protein [Oxalobacteraceae bacterium A2-2]
MAQVPTGTTFHIATSYAAPKTVTGISNAAEAVVSCTAHGYANGDVVEISSGWGRINRRVFRVKAAAADVFTLEGVDTTNQTFFPAASSPGTVRKITAFTQILKVVGTNTSGGESKDVEYKYTESDVAYKINDGFSATSYTLDLDADAISDPGYQACKTLTQVQTDTCLRMNTRNGGVLYQPCTVALNEAVKLADGQINKVSCAFNGNNTLTRY